MIPGLRRRRENPEFETSLNYIARFHLKSGKKIKAGEGGHRVSLKYKSFWFGLFPGGSHNKDSC